MVSWTGGVREAGDPPVNVEAAVRRMRERGYKATPQRLAIVRALAEDPHQSVGELQRCCAWVGTVTVYRTLDLLVEIGIVRRVGLRGGLRYELTGEHRHHFVCEPCGGVFDLPELASGLEEALAGGVGAGGEIDRVEIHGRCRGRCPACTD